MNKGRLNRPFFCVCDGYRHETIECSDLYEFSTGNALGIATESLPRGTRGSLEWIARPEERELKQWQGAGETRGERPKKNTLFFPNFGAFTAIGANGNVFTSAK